MIATIAQAELQPGTVDRQVFRCQRLEFMIEIAARDRTGGKFRLESDSMVACGMMWTRLAPGSINTLFVMSSIAKTAGTPVRQ